MRKAWTNHVAEVRRKGNRGKKTMTYREAMQAASQSWPKTKAKLERKTKRSKSSALPEQKVNASSENETTEA